MSKAQTQKIETYPSNDKGISGMKILVTGCAGYLGSKLLPALLRIGHKVTGFDVVKRHSLFDVAGEELLTLTTECPKLESFDAIIHLAAIVGAQACDAAGRDETRDTNWDLTTRLLMQKKAYHKFIFTNTNCGYQGFHCDEKSEIKPQSYYAETKMRSEKEVIKAGGISLRFASLFGVSPRMRDDLLLNFLVKEAVTKNRIELYESNFKRNFIHVKDAVRAITHALTTLENGEIYNVGIDDVNITKMELAQRIKEYYLHNLCITEVTGPKDPDERNYIVSNAKIGKTGFNTYFSIDDGISELIKYYNYVSQA